MAICTAIAQDVSTRHAFNAHMGCISKAGAFLLPEYASEHGHYAAAMETHRGDEGQDEAAAAAHFAVVGAVLHMLPQQPSILLVHADRLLNQHRLACTGTSSDADHSVHRECRR